MPLATIQKEGDHVVLHTDGGTCATTQEVVESEAFAWVVQSYVGSLRAHHAPLLTRLGIAGIELPGDAGDAGLRALIELIRLLANNPYERVAALGAGEAAASTSHGEQAAAGPDERRGALHQLVEGLYDHWRSYDRFMVAHADNDARGLRGSHRSFNLTMERFAMLARGLYRDVVENITGDHPRVYRQVSAGAEVGLVAARREWPAPAPYRRALAAIPFVRHVVIDPPFIIDPPTNRRTGEFVEVQSDPIAGLRLDPARWLCYPAVVGPTLVFVYVDQRFIGLGSALANLFELATDAQIEAGPDAVYLFGVPPEAMSGYGALPTVFHEGAESGLLAAAIPAEDRFGYFGYLKKMVLTLHNVAVLKRGRMPYHGAFTRVVLEGGAAANILIIGDTATGKSETLEALRELAGDEVSDLRVVADDMGSLCIREDGAVVGYGTEVGAFVRLDDLSKGYAFRQLDRAIFMSPQKVNARVVVPVTTLEEVLRGYRVDLLLYANNYEAVDEGHPVIERFGTAEAALHVFRAGRAMSKGTTTSIGLTETYFANIFGAAQRREQHEVIAREVFAAAFRRGMFVGQLRTRLGLQGWEVQGPRAAAAALLECIASRSGGP